MKELIHKYIGSFFWAIKNKKRLGGKKIRLTDDGWVVCMSDIIPTQQNFVGKEKITTIRSDILELETLVMSDRKRFIGCVIPVIILITIAAISCALL